jgi:hypothetical protein
MCKGNTPRPLSWPSILIRSRKVTHSVVPRRNQSADTAARYTVLRSTSGILKASE